MARDRHLAKRNALVLTGGLVAFWSLVALAYAQWYRVPPEGCLQGEVLLGGCRAAGLLLLPLALVGLVLVTIGLSRYPSRPHTLEGHLHLGTGSHFTIALFASIVAVCGLSFIYIVIKAGNLAAGEHIVVTIAGTEYMLAFVLKLAILVGAVGLTVALGMYLAQAHLRHEFLRAADRLGAEPPPEDGFGVDREAYAALDDEVAYGDQAHGFRPADMPAPRMPPPATMPTAAQAPADEGAREEPDRWRDAFTPSGPSDAREPWHSDREEE